MFPQDMPKASSHTSCCDDIPAVSDLFYFSAHHFGKNEGRIEGKLEGKIELIIKKYKKGCTAEETADMLEEPPSQIRQIYDAIGQCVPDYNVEKIYKRLSDQTV